jgi:hydroxymethylbilane synthase
MKAERAISIATRGSALALAQANAILDQCRKAFPNLSFELNIVKTTGDKFQTASLALEGQSLPKGLFTKELEVALLEGKADLAVHSLKDLPTELPAGLELGAVTKRADARDVLVYRDANFVKPQTKRKDAGPRLPGQLPLRGFRPKLQIEQLPGDAVVASSSTRRRAQLLMHNPGIKIVEIRGNVLTRMIKLAENPELDATVLALAGITRLNFRITPEGRMEGDGVPAGLLAVILETEVMLPCVGQGAIGIEVRAGDTRTEAICEQLNHIETLRCVMAERAFLAAMGGGCQSPVAAYAEAIDNQLWMRAISFANGPVRRSDAKRPLTEAVQLGQQIAAELRR